VQVLTHGSIKVPRRDASATANKEAVVDRERYLTVRPVAAH